MNQIPAVICFALPETQVDQLIEITRDSTLKKSRWIVFGQDMNRLGGLVALWKASIDLTIVHMQRVDTDYLEAALTILNAEQVSLPECIWLQGETTCIPMQKFPNSARLSSDVGGDDALRVLIRLSQEASRGQ